MYEWAKQQFHMAQNIFKSISHTLINTSATAKKATYHERERHLVVVGLQSKTGLEWFETKRKFQFCAVWIASKRFRTGTATAAVVVISNQMVLDSDF